MATICLWAAPGTKAQLIYYKDKIYSPYTLDDAKAKTRRDKLVKESESLLTLPLGTSDESAEQVDVALWGISQFLVKTPRTDSGIARVVANFHRLSESTQRSVLEVLYGLYPKEYYTQVLDIMQQSRHPKNFAMAAAYVYRAHPTEAARQLIHLHAARMGGKEGQVQMIKSLLQYIDNYGKEAALPDTDSLFARQQVHGFKVIYSFQRSNRDYAGLAIVQKADGSFLRDSTGQLRTFTQLARSASNLPWFITNGSTPQGLYTITGTAISKNVFIGPTPNLQMAMMHEVSTPVFTHYFPPVLNATPERLYRSYFPDNWHQWGGMWEAYQAGKIGRGEIIAHGSTIDPRWYAGHPFYPLTPTMGCLSGLELWDKTTGKIAQSDQLDLVNAFIESAGTKGYMMVINLDGQAKPVERQELEQMVGHYEAAIKKAATQTVAAE